jgi:hypothetical protein
MREASINLSQQTLEAMLISDSQCTGKGLAVNRSPRVAAAAAAATIGIVFAPAVPALAHPHAPGNPGSPSTPGLSNGSSTNPDSRPNAGPRRNFPETPRGGIFDDIKDRIVDFFTDRVHPPFHG